MFLFGSVSVGTADGTPRKGALMVPVISRSFRSSPDNPDLGRDPRVATPAVENVVTPPRAPPYAFEVRCSDAHPASCAEVLGAERAGDVVALACEHGALV